MTTGFVNDLLRFGVVGVVNTALDFLLFNWLIGRWHWKNLRAHCCSSSTAMFVSFLLNRDLVFPGTPLMERLPQFLIITGFSLYVVQGSTLTLVTKVWPGHGGGRCMGWLNRPEVGRNVGKALASLAGLSWNFCWYKWYVFAQ